MTFRKTTYIFILRSIVFSLLFSLPPYANAQSAKKKAGLEKLRLKAIDDSIPLFNGFQVMTDLVGPIQKLTSAYGQYEVGVRVNLKDKYFPIVEMGYGMADKQNEITLTRYKTKAPYGKIGADFNILKNKHDIYRVYVGFRYALTYFKFDLHHENITDPVWGGDIPFGGQGINANCHWIEILAAIDAKIWGPLHLGWSVRYKRRVKQNSGELGNVWYVPGYGKQGTTRLGGTFNVILDF